MTATTSALTQLATAEQALVGTLNLVSARFDRIATGGLDEALLRVQASADAARARLTAAYSAVQSIASDVLDNIADVAALLAAQVAAGLEMPANPPSLPAPTSAEPIPRHDPNRRAHQQARRHHRHRPQQSREGGQRLRGQPRRRPARRGGNRHGRRTGQRGILSQEQADGIATQAERFARAAANPPVGDQDEQPGELPISAPGSAATTTPDAKQPDAQPRPAKRGGKPGRGGNGRGKQTDRT